ncbi:uracil-DNA glycosylase [Clostridium thermosuccinogenes]|jgi:DNA polymerase|uniref:Type-4 uracil-DNA glycosylase n=1 Tax=Clostridium thermosuccinogenes TaxID=84032 RepID=A0A2K2FA37_9CLOT|nr:uracil-DNA glycosylase [Pseudoclostridium thermosuccinogenes]AUS96400.1 uracil-DNA glycosylase [Pseudoclostridium thermosuccinogenes]PNT92934.1 uracil-DNA glycosylase [Pseudoclostridium thermosuccinogenes]PNT95650.1 uracil-DNA glycosylase [Pseudoclostridium thermosuccinogenes]PNT96873.1 uracil-DNA glycosylase [Pseudoclostridium thermosuccinogenes]
MPKRELLNELYGRYINEFGDKEIVLGDGNIDSEIVLVGEAPGKDEVKLSKPFVGAAGKNLSQFMDILGIKREDIYITNVIKHRLSKINPNTGRIINRAATKADIDAVKDYLLQEIRIIDPVYVVTLGNVPLKAATGDYGISIGTVHGQTLEVEVLDKVYKFFPLYHPASIIYNRSLKEIYLDDLKKLSQLIKG